jgi:PAS domain S-box-containing protein
MTLGPPMLFTHMDGKVLFGNASARALLPEGSGDQPDIKTAIPWKHPDIIRNLYRDIMAGSEYATVMTDIGTPSGDRTVRVQAHGIQEMGNITSQVLIHIMDETEAERTRQLVASTMRALAAEKDLLDRVVTQVSVTFTVVDRDLRILRVNDAVAAKFARSKEDMVGRRLCDLNPMIYESGLADRVETALAEQREIHIPRFSHITRFGKEVALSLWLIPMEHEGKQACVIISEDLAHEGHPEEAATGRSELVERLFASLDTGIILVDAEGIIREVNPPVVSTSGIAREEAIGRPIREITGRVVSDEGLSLLMGFLEQVLRTGEALETGPIELRGPEGSDARAAGRARLIPLLGPEGRAEGVAIVTRVLAGSEGAPKTPAHTMGLEPEIGLEAQGDRSTTSLLKAVAGKMETLARSGVVLSSLHDGELMVTSFLHEVEDVLRADFVSVVLLDTVEGSSKSTYYSSGTQPPAGEVPHDLIERNLARLVLGGEAEDMVTARDNLITMELAGTRSRGLVVAWKRHGAFTDIDVSLCRLMTLQLGLGLTITRQVGDLRLERDRSQSLRRIAFRAAWVSSVKAAITIVAEEISKVIGGSRFFWIVLARDGDAWLSEIFRPSGIPKSDRKHVTVGGVKRMSPMIDAIRESHRLFCERYPSFGEEAPALDKLPDRDRLCPFVREPRSRRLQGSLRFLLRESGFLEGAGGSMIAAPVMLSENLMGMLCAYGESSAAFGPDDSCFMCLAASTIAHMWQAADASSSVRRLEAAGDSVRELAHDLKYPLRRIKESLSGLSGDGRSWDEGTAEDALREIDRLVILAQELIDISSPGRRYELVDIAEVLEDCIELTAGDVAERAITLRYNPRPLAAPAFVNRKDVKKIFLSVLANSIEAAGQQGFIEIRTMQEAGGGDGDWLRIEFSDSGTGVPETDLERVFDPLYSTKDGGSGLGLHSAKKRARGNGGDVFCEVGEGGRSRFVVRFPGASG